MCGHCPLLHLEAHESELEKGPRISSILIDFWKNEFEHSLFADAVLVFLNRSSLKASHYMSVWSCATSVSREFGVIGLVGHKSVVTRWFLLVSGIFYIDLNIDLISSSGQNKELLIKFHGGYSSSH